MTAVTHGYIVCDFVCHKLRSQSSNMLNVNCFVKKSKSK